MLVRYLYAVKHLRHRVPEYEPLILKSNEAIELYVEVIGKRWPEGERKLLANVDSHVVDYVDVWDSNQKSIFIEGGWSELEAKSFQLKDLKLWMRYLKVVGSNKKWITKVYKKHKDQIEQIILTDPRIVGEYAVYINNDMLDIAEKTYGKGTAKYKRFIRSYNANISNEEYDDLMTPLYLYISSDIVLIFNWFISSFGHDYLIKYL